MEGPTCAGAQRIRAGRSDAAANGEPRRICPGRISQQGPAAIPLRNGADLSAGDAKALRLCRTQVAPAPGAWDHQETAWPASVSGHADGTARRDRHSDGAPDASQSAAARSCLTTSARLATKMGYCSTEERQDMVML